MPLGGISGVRRVRGVRGVRNGSASLETVAGMNLTATARLSCGTKVPLPHTETVAFAARRNDSIQSRDVIVDPAPAIVVLVVEDDRQAREMPPHAQRATKSSLSRTASMHSDISKSTPHRQRWCSISACLASTDATCSLKWPHRTSFADARHRRDRRVEALAERTRRLRKMVSVEGW